MREHLLDAWHTLAPPRGGPHGPLPVLMVALTAVTGLVDAFSYLELRHVFVANMTGNVVFLAFSLGGAHEFVWWASLLAIVAFAAGALAGGRIAHVYGAHRGRHLYLAATAQAVLVVAAFVLGLVLRHPYASGPLTALIILLGVGMGIQNATARALAIPDLTTTVLTLTITGISADSAPAGGKGSKLGRRAVSIVSMFLGGLVGALLIKHGDHGRWVLLIATVLLLAIVAVTARTRTSTETWTAAKGA